MQYLILKLMHYIRVDFFFIHMQYSLALTKCAIHKKLVKTL